ncbi:MAG TPA: IclR family transcriptional regulator [Sphingobium sp.]|nr:IclR family transcriptional regulator [Sphingobium sp.]
MIQPPSLRERAAPPQRTDGSSSVKSATRTLDILEFVVSHGRPVSSAEIAATLRIPISSLSYLLGTLIERGYLLRAGRLHSPGPALARLQTSGRESTLLERVSARVRSISVQLNETAAFFVRQGYEMEAIASEVSAQPLRYSVEVGRLLPLHAFSAGKAILATFSADELDHYFRTVERTAYTPQTVVEEGAMRAELAQIGRHGLARTGEEYTAGIVGIGRSVVTAEGVLLGALSVAIPIARATPALEERAATLLLRASDVLGGLGPA